jgi:hypothetical protein
MPGRGRLGPGAASRTTIPLATVTRRQARLAGPGSPNRFLPLAEPQEHVAHAPGSPSGPLRPRTSSEPPTPSRTIRCATPAAAELPATALPAQSPIHTRDSPTGPGPETEPRAVAFNLPPPALEPAETAPFHEVVRRVADEIDLLIKETQALYPEEAGVLSSIILDPITAFSRFLEPRPDSSDQRPPWDRAPSRSASPNRCTQRSSSRASQGSTI